MPDAGRASSASAAPACERSARPHAPDAPRLLPSQCRPRTARPPAEPSCPHRSPDPADPGCTPEPSSPPPPRSRGLARFIPAVNPAPESETAEPALALIGSAVAGDLTWALAMPPHALLGGGCW